MFSRSLLQVSRSAVVSARSMSKLSGNVKWFDKKKGFGFIVPSNGAPEVFVHQSEIKANGFRFLHQGEEVEFELSDDNGKVKAVSVTGPGGANVKGHIPGQN